MQELEDVAGVEVFKNLPTIDLTAAFFNFDINPEGNADIGSRMLDGEGIPPDFFTDKDIRQGFAYSFDWETYLRDLFFNEAVQPVGPIPEGLAFRKTDQETYYLDRDRAVQHFQQAWNGQVWEKGFSFTILYNTGYTQAEAAAYMFKEQVESLNPRFHIEVRSVEWSTYLRELVQRRLTMFIIGWVADFADAHNFVRPFMHSQGDVAGLQGYENPLVDELIWRAINTTDTEQRRRMYHQLQTIYYDDCPSVPLHQMLRRHYQQEWVEGWYYNPILPASHIAGYLYTISKRQD
jgi:peptide/nickel transport system substrate-binding protein